MNAALPFWNFYTVYTLASCIVLLIMYITCRLMQGRISAFSLEQRTAEMINLHEGSNHVEPPSQTGGQSIGLTTAIIHTLPTISFKRVTKKGMSHANNECVICLDEFSEEDWLRLLPNCAHVFHLSCVDTWLRSHSTCPICRKNVIRNDSSCECSTFISVDGLMATLRREETSGGRPLEHHHVDLPTMQSAELGLEMIRSSVSESDSEESVTTVSSVTEGPNNRITTTEN